MSSSIFNGDSVKILKNKLKYKSGSTVEESNGRLVVTDLANKKTTLEESKDKSVWQVLNAENDLITDWTNTGSGVFILDTVNPINGSKSYKFTAAVQNDVVSRLVTPVFRNKGKENSVSLQYTLDVLGIECQIFDTATSTIIEQIPLTVETASKTLNLPFILKDTSTTIELRFVNTHATNTPTIKFDDISFSDNPFVYKNLLNIKRLVAAGNAAQTITANVTNIPFIASIDEAGAWNGSQYIVPFDSDITINGGVHHTAVASDRVQLTVNGVFFKNISNNVGNSGASVFSYVGNFLKGDVLALTSDTSYVLSNSTTFHHFSITAQAESEHVITPVKSNINNYSARISNNSVASIISQDYDAIASVNRTTLGTVLITFKSGLFSVPPSAVVTQVQNSSDRGINIKTINATSIIVVTYNGSTGAIADRDFNIHISAQWPDVKNATFLGAIPSRRIAQYSYSNLSTTASIVGTVTIPIDIVKGDTSFSSLNLNQITLQPGDYVFRGSSRTYVSLISYAFIYDITNAMEVTRGTAGYSNTSAVISPSVVNSEKITFATSVILELRNTSQKAQINGISQAGESVSHLFTIEKLD